MNKPFHHQAVEYSIVIPVYNEEENISRFYQEWKKVLQSSGKTFEMIFVDDGSLDGSVSALERETKDDGHVKIVLLREHGGKSSALQTGFDLARGWYVITVDGDCQYDPGDVSLLVRRIEEDRLDVVCGWRKDRCDTLFRTVVARLANYLRRVVFREKIHDVGCPFRIYKRDILKDIRLKREQHRFLTVILKKKGCAIGEAVVRHYPRLGGKSKFGTWDRLITSIPDFFDLLFRRGRPS